MSKIHVHPAAAHRSIPSTAAPKAAARSELAHVPDVWMGASSAAAGFGLSPDLSLAQILGDPSLAEEVLGLLRLALINGPAQGPKAAARTRRYEGTERTLNQSELASIQPGKILDRTPAQMKEMYNEGGALLPKGSYWEKLHDHGTGKPWRAGGDGTVIARSSSYPRGEGHRDITIDVVDISKLPAGVEPPKTREDVEALKRTHPEVITSVKTRTNADVAVKLEPGHEYVAMGPSGTMSMMANASQMTSREGINWS
jgi:hypothetical protein